MTLTGFTGLVVNNKEVFSHSLTVLDVHQLPAAAAITGEAKDAKVDGTTVTAVEEGGTVYLWVTVGNSQSRDKVSNDEAFHGFLVCGQPGPNGGFPEFAEFLRSRPGAWAR